MKCTDDDLKLLKERMREADVPASHAKLLIARLEASENKNDAWDAWSREIRSDHPRERALQTLQRAVEKSDVIWRKIARE